MESFAHSSVQDTGPYGTLPRSGRRWAERSNPAFNRTRRKQRRRLLAWLPARRLTLRYAIR
jgi:hypothetical protein